MKANWIRPLRYWVSSSPFFSSFLLSIISLPLFLQVALCKFPPRRFYWTASSCRTRSWVAVLKTKSFYKWIVYVSCSCFISMLNYFLIIVFCVCAIIDKRIKMIVCKVLALFVCYLRVLNAYDKSWDIISCNFLIFNYDIPFTIVASRARLLTMHDSISYGDTIQVRLTIIALSCIRYSFLLFYAITIFISMNIFGISLYLRYKLWLAHDIQFYDRCMSCSMTNFGAQLA